MGPHRLLLAIKKNPELRVMLGINVENDLKYTILSLIPPLRFKEGIRNLYILGKRLAGKQRIFSVQMINYVSQTWVNGSFPPSTWIMYNHKGQTTNNHSEGYNYRLGHNSSIEKHPNTYRWVETIVQELRNSENEAIMAKTGNANSRPHDHLKSQLRSEILV